MIALYARTSTEDQVDKNTIQGQLDFLRNFAKLYGLDIYQEYIDDGLVGTVPLGDRPGGSLLLHDAHYRHFDTLVVYRLDRLGRSLTTILDAYSQLETLHVIIRSATEPFDTATAIGKFLFQFLGSLAELERSTITERMTLGRVRVAKRGKWTNGPLPYGYVTDSHGNLTPSRILIPSLGVSESENVTDVFRRMADGSTSVQEALRLNAFGVPRVKRFAGNVDAKSAAKWGSSAIRYIIKNPVYTGKYTVKSRMGSIECEVDPLVSQELWEQANAQLAANQDKPKGQTKTIYLLRGLIKCAHCGSSYIGNYASDGRGWNTHYYRCAKRLRDGRQACNSGSVPVEKIEGYVWGRIVNFILNPDEAVAKLQEKIAAYLDTTKDAVDRQIHLQETLLEKGKARDRIKHLFVRGHITPDEMEEEYRAIDKEISLLRQELDTLHSQNAMANMYTQYYENITSLLHSLHETAVSATLGQKQQIIARFVAGIEITTHMEGRRRITSGEFAFHFDNSHVTFDRGEEHERARRVRQWTSGTGQ
jgi:site-specific DNA recombinase